MSTTVIELRQVIHAEREVPQGETDGRAATQEPTKRSWGTTRTPGWHPEETASQLPLVNEKRYPQFSVGGMSPQRGGGSRPQCVKGRGPKDPGVAGPLAAAGCCGNCWYVMGGRSRASARSSLLSHSRTSPSRTFPSGPSVLLPCSGLMDDAIPLSLSFDSGPRVFGVGGDSIGVLQAVIAVLQVTTVESIMSEIEIRFAGSERLESLKLGNVKPQKSFSSSPLATA